MKLFSVMKWSTLAGLLVATAACAEPPADVVAGRAMCGKWNNAIVNVQVVVKMTMSYDGESSKREEKGDTVGTVIDPSGLTVVSLSSVSPDSMFDSMYGEEDGPQISTEITDVKIRLSDGTEVPAKIVLRDKDLDLAFVRPSTKPKEPWKFVDLKDSATADVLDQVVTITRLGKVANRAISVSLIRIQAVLEKPRKFYVVDMYGDTGSPVGTLDGKILGIALLKMSAAASKSGSYRDSIMPVVLPAEDIAAVALQAPEDAPKEPEKPVAKEEPKAAPKAPAKAPAKPKTSK